MIDSIRKFGIPGVTVGTVLLLVAWWFLLYGPQLAESDGLRGRQINLEEQLVQIESKLERAKLLSRQVVDYESEWNRFTSSLFTTGNVDEILAELRRRGSGQDVRILDITLDFEPMIEKIGVTETKPLADLADLRMEGRGRFFAIGDFLDSLESEPAVAGVEFLKLAYQSSVDPEIYFEALVNVYVLTEEREDG